MLRLNAERFSPDPAEAEAERAEGYALYEEKPTLRKGNIKRVAADGETHTVFPIVPIRVSISGRVGAHGHRRGSNSDLVLVAFAFSKCGSVA